MNEETAEKGPQWLWRTLAVKTSIGTPVFIDNRFVRCKIAYTVVFGVSSWSPLRAVSGCAKSIV